MIYDDKEKTAIFFQTYLVFAAMFIGALTGCLCVFGVVSELALRIANIAVMLLVTASNVMNAVSPMKTEDRENAGIKILAPKLFTALLVVFSVIWISSWIWLIVTHG